MGGSIWPVQRTAPATLFNVSQTLSKRPSRAGPCRQRQSALLTSCADLSAGFLETVATMALKTRLKAYQQVETSMNCTAWGLLQGAVEGVQIRGQGWTSPLGLSARILEVTLGSARLDMGVLLRQQDIMLQNTPQGAARIVFNSTDFGNLLVHPLVKQLASRAIQGSGFLFDKYSVCICPDQGTSGAVEFSGVWTGDGHMYHLLLSPQGQRAHVSTRLADNGAASYAFFGSRPAGSDVVCAGLSEFFSNLTIDLQGPQLTYHSMQLVQGSEEGLLDLTLKIKVTDFPPLNLQF